MECHHGVHEEEQEKCNFDVLAAVLLELQILWAVILCCCGSICRRFGGTALPYSSDYSGWSKMDSLILK